MFDLVNEHDEVIGSATVQECHSNPKLIHRVAHFTLVDGINEKILISKRSADVKFDSGKWCFMGEHLLQGDDYPTAVFRGVKEELGLTLNWGCGEKCHTIFHSEKQTEFARFFIVYYKHGEIKPNPVEIKNIKWITLEELMSNKKTYSQMTQYWLENCNWQEIMSFSKAVLS